MDTCQHDLPIAVLRHTGDLPDDIFRLTTAFPSTYIRNDAVAAEIIAAKHNIDTRLKGIFTVSRHTLYDLIRFLPDINDLSLRI